MSAPTPRPGAPPEGVVDLLVLGGGGTLRDVLDIVDAVNAAAARAGGAHAVLRCIGCLDDNPALQGADVGGVPVLGPIADAHRWPGARLVNALGSPRSFRAREAATRRAATDDHRFLTLVHPAAVVSPRASVGRGALLFAGVFVGAHAVVGDHVTVLANSVVNHDARIEAFGIVASGVTLSGATTIGRGSYVGAGSHLRQGVSVGAGALVGMGAVVIRDVAAGAVVVGNPARELARRDGAPPAG